MLYAIFEITLFMLIATFLGFIIGWKLHNRIDSRWRTAYDSERQVSASLKKQLEDYRNSSLPATEENNYSTAAVQQKVSTTTSPETENRSPGTDSASRKKAVKTALSDSGKNNLPDKKSALKKVAEIKKRTAGNKPVNDDNLKKIKGIGPKLEKMLKDIGITSYRQIANFRKEDIQYVTAAIESFPGRIERDNWMKSAAALHRETYGDAL